MFSVVLPSRPCLTNPTPIQADPSSPATNFVFTFPAWPKFSHIVVFLLPGITLPADAAAAVYIQFSTGANPNPNPQDFRFLGAIANEKPSAIFKVNDPVRQRTEAEEEDEMLDAGSPPSPNINMTVTLGISIEPAQAVASKLATLKAQSASTELVRRGDMFQRPNISTKLLAQRIIGNAFNFLSSFATSDGREEMVPLKSFRDWWSKFERRIESDPGFLEREGSV
ncbi:uncharacterized protein CIMG_00668 [Coccidioides immitis RS]|uniref:Uncharacterized protein n=4 Tax=Coccidioides immitis TaxID=5501 RepID=J3KHH4_COCIM|nr:uncharacterized protein CIMG_00668 [Coccidioides immitis RS]KMP00562.1 DUF775 domain containing protein [Coccidioides immitis RMSCC 2394]KMU75918.1 hypothetical protein CISG_05403 [Coccidioides immitis RMSCC 3703]KMU89567.1 DUF775 domain-containing protein [Coccidioides immitis H538.4]TPX26398.1 hypothetical protein DIZ76_011860 [Coccidioides immitis]EAS35314.3 hypothetical protein CIMG_00668 [Coccidioides immitis RS]